MFSEYRQEQLSPSIRLVLWRTGYLLLLSTMLGTAFNALSPLGIRLQATAGSETEPRSGNFAGPPHTANEAQAVSWLDVKTGVEKGDLLLVDVRTAAEYEAGHVPGAVLLSALSDAGALAAFHRAHDTNTALVLYCGSIRCALSRNFARRLVEDYGYRSVSYIQGGYLEWQKLQFSDLPPVDLQQPSPISWSDAERLLHEGKAVLVDARLPAFYDAGHITGAVSLPFNTSPDEISRFRQEYAEQGQIVLYCERSTCTVAERFATKLVTDHGFRSVRFLSSGFEEWKVAQLNQVSARR